MTENDYILKARPNYLFISFAMICAIGSAYIGYLIFMSNAKVNGTDEKTGHVILVIVSGFFILYAVVCLYCFFKLEICYLTQDAIIISRPLLFVHHKILLSDIERITEKDAKIDIDAKSFTPKLVTIGHTTLIILKSGKQVKISSLEIWNYNTLIKKIHSEFRNRKP